MGCKDCSHKMNDHKLHHHGEDFDIPRHRAQAQPEPRQLDASWEAVGEAVSDAETWWIGENGSASVLVDEPPFTCE